MLAFSYAWSLPVTCQKRQSRHSIRLSWKPHAARRLHDSTMVYRTAVTAYL